MGVDCSSCCSSLLLLRWPRSASTAAPAADACRPQLLLQSCRCCRASRSPASAAAPAAAECPLARLPGAPGQPA
eukprot:7996626-Alexandrium_andersonii.AAC.1